LIRKIKGDQITDDLDVSAQRAICSLSDPCFFHQFKYGMVALYFTVLFPM